MTTARIASIATFPLDAYRQLSLSLCTLRARLAEEKRRREDRKMLLVARDLDHSGVLADLEAARASARQWRDLRTP